MFGARSICKRITVVKICALNALQFFVDRLPPTLHHLCRAIDVMFNVTVRRRARSQCCSARAMTRYGTTRPMRPGRVRGRHTNPDNAVRRIPGSACKYQPRGGACVSLTVFGFAAVGSMFAMYWLEDRSPWFV